MRSSTSTSLRRYSRWPVPDFFGESTGNSALPIAQDVRLHSEQFAYFADFEVQLIRNLRRSGLQRNICHLPFVILTQSVVNVTRQ